MSCRQAYVHSLMTKWLTSEISIGSIPGSSRSSSRLLGLTSYVVSWDHRATALLLRTPTARSGVCSRLASCTEGLAEAGLPTTTTTFERRVSFRPRFLPFIAWLRASLRVLRSQLVPSMNWKPLSGAMVWYGGSESGQYDAQWK